MSAGPEDILQMQVLRFLKAVAPDLLIWHTPNGGKRSISEARKFKDMGVLPGVADLCMVLPGGRFAAIELKAPKKYQEPTQKDFQAAIEARHALYAVCKSIEDVERTLRQWGVVLKGGLA